MQSLKQLRVSLKKLKNVNEMKCAYTGWLLFQQEHAKTQVYYYLKPLTEYICKMYACLISVKHRYFQIFQKSLVFYITQNIIVLTYYTF